MNKNLYLTGFMAAGKTTVGKSLARALGRKFLDMDDLVRDALGMNAQEAFARLGEEAFRESETSQLKRLSRAKGLVVATGGGLAQRAENRSLMRAGGSIVNLELNLEKCKARLSPAERDERPLWQNQAALEGLFKARQKAYLDCDLLVNADQPVEDIVETILTHELPEDSFTLKLADQATQIISTWQGPQALKPLLKSRKVVILTDRNLAGLHLERYTARLENPLVITLPPGERSKTLRSAEKVYKEMLNNQVERGDLLLALGGGVITDLGAFVAATYKRGMNFILASTSLLGCTDAAIGGKAAVNLDGEKNQVGLFTRPEAVILDLKALTTLPRSRRAEGITEAYKTGLVASPPLAEFAEARIKTLLKGDIPQLARLVNYSARAKALVVEKDFTESGLRKVLNLGHTVGHALEALVKPRPSHGVCVAQGIKVIARLCLKRGLIEEHQANQMIAALDQLTPAKMQWPSVQDIWRVMQHDKKNQGGKVSFVLLNAKGRPLLADDVSQGELESAILELKGGR
ncbi:bifunctional shikimate kinase/3-dehydroquinate synthase [Dethiosulfatarculus sandiegensis]|uniref:Shikimate kinase n=1 Tax=Dethiosulfatarculus sandiegensis TaxID=1429043 RepID=A0A0D2JTL9_9BACT|nr:bifunctional shikimate kinase/3-dehydroquinate synthase [Dethiosulfatarculus sandiegensis]KIX12850.1 hypothetical protein X474_17370 [Dethiosulfatarculus sandiegensis]